MGEEHLFRKYYNDDRRRKDDPVGWVTPVLQTLRTEKVLEDGSWSHRMSELYLFANRKKVLYEGGHVLVRWVNTTFFANHEKVPRMGRGSVRWMNSARTLPFSQIITGTNTSSACMGGR